MGDQVADPVDAQMRSHESTYSKPGNSNVFQSSEMVTPGVNDYPDSSKIQVDSKDLKRIGSSVHANAIPRCMDGAGVMVEELTFGNNDDGEKMVVVDTSNTRERMQSRRNQWQNLYQIAGGSGISNLPSQTGLLKGKGRAATKTMEAGGSNAFSKLNLIDQTQSRLNYNPHETVGSFMRSNHQGTSGDALHSSEGLRTKILSKSGFSAFFMKNKLRGKGAMNRNQGFNTMSDDQDLHSSKPSHLLNTAAPFSRDAQPMLPHSVGVSDPLGSSHLSCITDGISLREWLEAGRNNANNDQSLRIFRQVLDIVDYSHSHGAPIEDLRPSCLKLTVDCQVRYRGSSVRGGAIEKITDSDTYQASYNRYGKRPINQSKVPVNRSHAKKQRLGESTNFMEKWPQFPSRFGSKSDCMNVMKSNSGRPENCGHAVDEEHNAETEKQRSFNMVGDHVPNVSQSFQVPVNCSLEVKWYTSPELSREKGSTFSSNIYCLGVLLFELLGSFDSGRSHTAAMFDLQHRILPPSFLSENPQAAGFCLWLLHPEPSLRPTTREILQSEFVSAIQESSVDTVLTSIDEEDADSELLSHFLLALNERKQKDASTLLEQIQLIEADIQEIEKRQSKRSVVLSHRPQEVLTTSGSNFTSVGKPNLVTPKLSDKETRSANNMRQLESAYFSIRSRILRSDTYLGNHRYVELLKSRENWCSPVEEDNDNMTDLLGDFYDGLCKYARYSKFKVRGILRNGEFSNSANVICSLNFDRDEDYLATAGVSKKIKIFEFQALLSDSVDVHYPVVEMTNKSKLSCLCWNSYIRNYLASTDYDGIVKLWDASSGQVSSEFSEHSERAWSVDFSRVDPTKLASGGDDRLVKLWSINDRASLCSIRSNANVCCVQFSTDSPHLLAFSSADYKTYCYDLRNVSRPWCVLAGHEKAVSYAKFLDARTLVSASTDNTLKIWDLSKTSSNSVSRDACILTLKGHTNEKNFVGLSVADGYITCGSETNEVFAYHKSLPMPITTHKFGSIDSITGKETEEDNGQFVSSVCWRRKANMVVSANSSGCIKLLQMV